MFRDALKRRQNFASHKNPHYPTFMKFPIAMALLALSTFAITGMALAQAANEASVMRTEAQLLAHVDVQLAFRLAVLKAAR